MALKEKFYEFQDAFIQSWLEYKKLCDELNTYRGAPLNDDDAVMAVNKIIRQIQEKFHELYPAFIFVKEQYRFSGDAIYEYNKFIDDIKKAGATEEGRA